MANKLLNLCLDVTAAGVKVSLKGQAGASTPAHDGPYYFQVFYKPEGTPNAVQGESITVDAAGPCRVVAWDAQPDEIPSTLFTEPTWQAVSVETRIEGGDYGIVSAGSQDPWPPT